ncbi:hypothetical protein CANCADRAFT_15653, partial [Tortispora caseinolytica NRRL Y-17796]
PKQQSASETISKLCDRLSHATHLEDRRAAVMGLKGFSREYRESVIAGGVKPLIMELHRDTEDLDTAVLVLETLSILLEPTSLDKAAEDPDYLVLWLADELTQKQDNMDLLIDLLQSEDFFIRLYVLQLIRSALLYRVERTQHCILASPLAISRLVSLLDDPREAIRNEVAMLLVLLVDSHSDIQKLVVFENAFPKIFDLLDSEDGVLGGPVVYDYFHLLYSLLKFNVSNQNYFRESNCIARINKLIVIPEPDGTDPTASLWDPQTTENMVILLDICRLFLIPDQSSTSVNQTAFIQNDILLSILRLSFAPSSNIKIRINSLLTAADLIRAAPEIQDKINKIDVPLLEISNLAEQGRTSPRPDTLISVTQALINWVVQPASVHVFDLRIAAFTCLDAYLYDNYEEKSAFLDSVISIYSKTDTVNKLETTDVLSVILDYTNEDRKSDPYSAWFACVLMLHVLDNENELKRKLAQITSGNADAGEEVVTAVQMTIANLINAIETNQNSRIPVAYLMLLQIWIFEELDLVNEILDDKANVSALIAAAADSSTCIPAIKSMCSSLLCILYGFSGKSSAIPRKELMQMISSRIPRDQLVLSLQRLRDDPNIKEFETIPIFEAPKDTTGLPEVYFDRLFVDFFKDVFFQIYKAIDEDPESEPVIYGRRLPGGSRLTQVLDTMNTTIKAKDKLIAELQQTVTEKDTAAENTKKLFDDHIEQLRKQITDLQAEKSELQLKFEQLQKDTSSATERIQASQRESEAKSDQIKALSETIDKLRAETTENQKTIAQLTQNIAELEKKIETERTKAEQELANAVDHEKQGIELLKLELSANRKKAKDREAMLEERQKQSKAELSNGRSGHESELEEAHATIESMQAELDNLTLLIAYVDEKNEKYKSLLKSYGQEVSEDE